MPHVNSWETYHVKQEDCENLGYLNLFHLHGKTRNFGYRENQIVRAIPRSFRKSWTAIWGDEIFPLFLT